jgi:N-carbamoyl-L-amino-acid hydrolase
MLTDLRIDGARLVQRLDDLARIGARGDGGVCRLALTDADKEGRDLVVRWMRELGLTVTVDRIGNVFGRRPGRSGLVGGRARPALMTGSHIDTVATGGRFDGNYGVLAGLEVVETLADAGHATEHPLEVAFFTSEEGARFAPDMLGSLVHVGGMGLAEALAVRDADGLVLGEELERIGYAGLAPVGAPDVHRFVELHIEQGPVLEAEGVTIGAVRDLQGISWLELTIRGQSNHAGTTPMRLRHDAGYAAAAIATWLRELTRRMGDGQLATAGVLELVPDLVNVIAGRARMTVDLRNTDEARLQEAERELAAFTSMLAASEGVAIEPRRLARFEPVTFDPGVADTIARVAASLGHSVRDMTAGAGHDAHMLARVCPAAMIFVPSIGGISHNPREDTSPADLATGADVLLHTLLELDREPAGPGRSCGPGQ